MKNIIIFFIFFQLSFSQNKPVKFYNEQSIEITKKDFFEYKKQKKYLDVHIINDSIQQRILLPQTKQSKLDPKTFNYLKTYLTAISKTKIDSTQNLVINYVTGFIEKNQNTYKRSKWDIFDKNYLDKLHKKDSIKQFWINSPKVNNLEYYHKNKINWITDKHEVLKKIFFPYDVHDGYSILIKPNGEFFYYISEHGKIAIWKKSKNFFK